MYCVIGTEFDIRPKRIIGLNELWPIKWVALHVHVCVLLFFNLSIIIFAYRYNISHITSSTCIV